ncbi:MAG: replicative DNA helicase [Legionellales bacterium]|nr:replicative DNA helicase [Legionellales bacterium]
MTTGLVKSSKRSTDLSVEQVKMPPQALEAEQSVLGSLMIDNNAWESIVDRIEEKDFYHREHRLIFKAIAFLEQKSQPFDVVTLTETLKLLGELENIGGELYLFELSRNTPSAGNIKAYADIVHERSVLRQLIGVATEIADIAYHPEGRDSLSLLDEAERKVFEIAGQKGRGSGPQRISSFLAMANERAQLLSETKQTVTGLATGYIDFDAMTSGLQPADLVIVAGRPSMGKTTFAMNIAENAAMVCDKPVLIFSMEMPGDALAMRMMSSLGRIELQRLRKGDLNDGDWPNIASVVSMLSERPMFIDDTPALTPTELRARARRVARENGPLGLIVIDYLQLMRVGGQSENRTAEISEISRSLKALAKELSVPVIALSQLNRSLEQRADRRPVMSDLRESGAIEQDADLIAFIYRDEVYNPDTRDKGIAEIIIAKQRNGPIGKVHLTFLGHFTRFENAADQRRYGGEE